MINLKKNCNHFPLVQFNVFIKTTHTNRILTFEVMILIRIQFWFRQRLWVVVFSVHCLYIFTIIPFWGLTTYKSIPLTSSTLSFIFTVPEKFIA